MFLGQFWCHFWTPWPQKPLEKSFWVHIFHLFWIYFNYYLSRGRPLEIDVFSTVKYPFCKNGRKIRNFWEIFWEIFLFTIKLLILSIISKWAKIRDPWFQSGLNSPGMTPYNYIGKMTEKWLENDLNKGHFDPKNA